MTRISRKLISCILGALACMAIVFGIMIARPQAKTATAATQVTFNAASLEGIPEGQNYQQIIFYTSGLQWTCNLSKRNASDWASISDYTTVNGRTLTELENASTSGDKITFTLQGAGTFSFLRLFIPLSIIEVSDVKAVGILDGWLLEPGDGTSWTASGVSYLRPLSGSGTMVAASSYTDLTTKTSADITIHDATISETVDNDTIVKREDSYLINIDFGLAFTANGGYNPMYDSYKYARQAIYINGKSIDEWNTQKIAEDSRFADPAMYSKFPQNSTTDNHAATFAKPVALWGTSSGFQVSIFQELIADCETVTVTIGAGCTDNSTFIIAERVSKEVLTQNVMDITERLTFLDNTANAPTAWSETCNLYYFHMNDNTTTYWTTEPAGGCLNEADPSGGVGGQTQMKYIYFNGTSLYDINSNDDGAYGSTGNAIADNGGAYAPIYVEMSAEVGGALKLTIPKTFTNGKDAHEEIIIKKGFNFVANGTSYYVRNDIVVSKASGTWTKTIKPIEKETTVSVTNAYHAGNFLTFVLGNNDYPDVVGTEPVHTDATMKARITGSNLFEKIFIRLEGETESVAVGSQVGELIFYLSGAKDSFSFRATRIPGGDNVDWATLMPEITIKAGAQFPCYDYVKNGGELRYYVTTEDYVCYYDGTQWVEGNRPDDGEVDITADLTFTDQGDLKNTDGTLLNTETYLIKTSSFHWTGISCVNKATGGDELLKNIYFNGISIYNINENDDGTYGSENATIKGNADCAPIVVYLASDANKTFSYIQIHVPTGYPNEGATAEENHKSITIGADFAYTENDTTWIISKDLTWINLNGSWVSEDTTFAASTVTIGNPRIEGVANELYKVDITSNSWNITCNDYDFMYGNAYATYRQYIFINGVSVYDINTNTDDSDYTYSTGPMTGNSDELFAHPVLIQTFNQNSDSHKITLWIHEKYMESLGDDITITLGAGYNAFADGLSLAENVNYSMIANVTVDNGTTTTLRKVIKGNTVSGLFETPTKEMTETTTYTFENWYVAGTNTVYDPTTLITEDISLEARFTEETVNLIETEVVGITHYLKTSDEEWLAFELSEHDYAKAAQNYSMADGDIDKSDYSELLRIGFLDKVILKGSIVLNSGTVSEATLMDVYNSYGALQGPLLNFWGLQQFGMRLPVGDGVTEIVIQEGCFFPSYTYVSGGTTVDTRYAIMREATYKYDENMGVFVKQAAVEVDIQMEAGASVRVTSDMTTSGIRFQTNIAKADLETLQAAIGVKYSKVEFGTLIVPTDFLMGGSFTHDWLNNSGLDFLDIVSTVEIGDLTTFPVEYTDEQGKEYYSYFGSIVKLKETNYGRTFSGLGYIKLTDLEEKEIYIYAQYDAANKRSASFVANAAINDRQDDPNDEYKHLTENENYSPYTDGERTFLEAYIVWSNSAINSVDLGNLAQGKSATVEPATQKLAGAYVKLIYSTEVNLWGVFTYKDGDKTASEDFYLQAGTTEHKQYLDIFRYNGVGYGMDTSNLSMTSITLTNAELEDKSGSVKVYGLYSEAKTIDMDNQEIYLTVDQDDGSEMTVGAHLGIGGALTYLAKSGVYEGVIGGSSGWDSGTVAITTGDPTQVFGTAKNKYKSGSYSWTYSEEDPYYGSATGSKPSDGAVNLINNFDAGRQIQQSWYAEVGGSDEATDGSNGYNRAYCYTGGEGQYWPYNPVQAGDVVSNPGQIVDYEINTTKGYIYVKARAMDWAKGYDASNPCENAVEGGVTTKSYVENYYRLNTDGTLVVNNGFVDWNGFTDMESCGWASTELPAVYPVHTLNYYVSNIDGDGTWEDAVEFNNGLQPWTGGTAYHQFTNPANGKTKVEDWFAWANGGDGNAFGMGIYIPNVTRYTSGRSCSSTAYYTDTNFQNSNALPVDNYSQISGLNKVDMVTDFAERGNILADKGMMSNMQSIQYTYQSAYVSNTSYTAPGIDFRMEAYVPIEYSYVICLDTVDTIRSTFYSIMDSGTVTNAGNGYEKVGLDAWARADKKWTW